MQATFFAAVLGSTVLNFKSKPGPMKKEKLSLTFCFQIILEKFITCGFTCINSVNKLMTQLRSDLKTQSRAEAKSVHEELIVIANLFDFSQQNLRYLVEVWSKFEIICNHWVVWIVNENHAPSTVQKQVFNCIDNPWSFKVFLPSMNNDSNVSVNFTTKRCQIFTKIVDLT